MTIQEIRIGDKVQDRNGFEFEVVALFKDGTVYCDFDGNEADIWEFKVDELERVVNDVSGSIGVPPTRVRFWKNIHDDTTVEYGSVIDQTESHYIVIPDDDIRATAKWIKSKCDVLR